MEEQPVIESILVADCGRLNTKLLLLERVDDSYRFVAQSQALTTLDAPWSDLSIGVTKALEELESITGRTLYTRGRIMIPRRGLEGVDAFVVVTSAPEPLHLVLAGLVREMSLESALRAAKATSTDVKAILSREGTLQSPQETWSRTIRDIGPDVVMLVGGVDGGARRPVTELAEAIAIATYMTEKDNRPTVLYAGNTSLRPYVTKILGDITRVDIADNVHPQANMEHLGPARKTLEEYYIEKRLLNAPGMDTLQGWSRMPVVPASAAFSRVVDFLWHREGNTDRGTVGIDVGAATTTVASTFKGTPRLTMYNHGVVNGLLEWLENVPVERITRWIPEPIDEETLLSILHNRVLYPHTIPQDSLELWVELAVIREMMRSAMQQAQRSWNGVPMINVGRGYSMPYMDPVLVSGGALAQIHRPAQALLTILDGMQPVGISTILMDVNQAANAIGAVAGIKPVAAASALDSGAFQPMGTVISPLGRARRGETILRMRISYADQGQLDVEAKYGEIEIWPLPIGRKAKLTLTPGRRFDVGFGVGRGGTIEVIGGSVGLVVDARGRPLRLPRDQETRQRLLNRWIWDVGG